MLFCEKFENSKWPPFLVRQNFFGNSKWLLFRDTLWVKNFVEIQNGRPVWQDKTFLKIQMILNSGSLWVKSFVEIALSRTVFEIYKFLCFAIFAKNLKIQNGYHFRQDKFFFEKCAS